MTPEEFASLPPDAEVLVRFGITEQRKVDWDDEVLMTQTDGSRYYIHPSFIECVAPPATPKPLAAGDKVRFKGGAEERTLLHIHGRFAFVTDRSVGAALAYLADLVRV